MARIIKPTVKCPYCGAGWQGTHVAVEHLRRCKQEFEASLARSRTLNVGALTGFLDTSTVSVALTPVRKARARFEVIEGAKRKAPPHLTRDGLDWPRFAATFLTAERPANEQKASTIARLVHDGQTDQNGDPYIEHPKGVVALMQTHPAYAKLTKDQQTTARTVAWLHDTLEDTALTAEDLKAAGFGDEVIATIEAVTTREREPKADYYERVKAAGPVALCVKLGDLAHNNLPERRAQLPGSPQNPVRRGEEDRYTKLGRKYWVAYTALGVEVPEHLRRFAS